MAPVEQGAPVAQEEPEVREEPGPLASLLEALVAPAVPEVLEAPVAQAVLQHPFPP